MTLSSLLIIIAAALLFGSIIGITFRPLGQWCTHSWRRLFFRPKLLKEFKYSPQSQSQKSQDNSQKEVQS